MFFFSPFFFPPFKRDGGSGVVVKWSGLGKVNLIQSASVNGHGFWGKLRGWPLTSHWELLFRDHGDNTCLGFL